MIELEIELEKLEINNHRIDIEIQGSKATDGFSQKVLDAIKDLDNQRKLQNFA